MKKYFYFFWLIAGGAWLVLAANSIVKYSLVWGRQCYFQVSWLSCRADLSVGEKVAVAGVITIVFAAFILYGRQAWQALKNPPAEEKKSWWRYWPAAIVALACVVVPFGSSDMNYYFNAGKAIHEGINPYIQEWPNRKDFVWPVEKNMVTSFSYGPLTASVFAWLYSLSDNVVWFMIAWRVIMLGFFVGSGALVVTLLKLYGADFNPTAVRMLWFTQPLLLFEWLVNGHFDVVWLVFLLLAFWAAHFKKWWLAIPCLVIGIWVKFIPVFMLPWFVLWWWQGVNKGTWRPQLGQAAIGLVLGGLITVAAWYPYWVGPGVFNSLIIQSKWAVTSYFAIIYYSLQPLFGWWLGTGAHWYLTRVVHAALFAVVVYLLIPYVKQVWRLIFKKISWDDSAYLTAIFVTMLVYLFVWQKSFWPWYAAWLLPFGIILSVHKNNWYAHKIAVWISLAPLTFYPVWLINWFITGADGGSKLWFYYFFVLTVSGYPLYLLFKWRQKKYAELDENKK